jgi:hypothetical protein
MKNSKSEQKAKNTKTNSAESEKIYEDTLATKIQRAILHPIRKYKNDHVTLHTAAKRHYWEA